MAAEIDVQPMRDISAPLELRKAAFGDIKTAPATSFSIAFIAIVLFMAALAIWATRGLRFRPTATPTSRSFMPIGQLVVERNFFGQSLRSLSLDWRKAMIEPGHPRHSIVRQCELASISRSSFYRGPTVENEATLRLMRLIDEQFLETPWYGSCQMARHLRRNGLCVGRHRVRRLMRA